MIRYAPCKINLGLRIQEKRPDTYHEIDSCFLPLKSPCDILTIAPHSGNGLLLESRGIDIGGGENILFRTYRLLDSWFPHFPALSVCLEKNIPIGAGLGGGSSDAAALLLYAKETFGLDEDSIRKIALQVGADVPFFLTDEPSRVQGIGERIERCSHSLSGYVLLLLVPPFSSNTALAYRRYDMLERHALTNEPFHFTLRFSQYEISWNCHNDLEEAVFPLFPELPRIKRSLLEMGALASAMSGSGSSIYGIFSAYDLKKAQNIAERFQKDGNQAYVSVL